MTENHPKTGTADEVGYSMWLVVASACLLFVPCRILMLALYVSLFSAYSNAPGSVVLCNLPAAAL